MNHPNNPPTTLATTTTAIDLYRRINDPAAFVRSLGLSIHRSGLFGTANVEQGEILALACISEGKPPLTLLKTYHVIQGRLSMRADAMLAGFRQLGGTHKIISRTPEKAEIELSIDGNSQRFPLTWAEAQQENYVWGREKNGKRALKDNWATPRSRMQMLWARVVSDGVRTMAPEVVSGQYTPEEVVDFSGGPTGGSDFNVIDVEVCGGGDAGVQDEQAVVASTEIEAGHNSSNALAAADVPAPTSQRPEAAYREPVNGPATEVQIEEIIAKLRLTKELDGGQTLAKVQAMMQARGIQGPANLTSQDADDLIRSLSQKLIDLRFSTDDHPLASGAVPTGPAAVDAQAQEQANRPN